MGSSAKKKREKKKDFQKPKLKVGKARPKPTNHTDTNFRAKAIVLDQQLSVEAPSTSNRILHNISLLSSRSEGQRKESLAFLCNFLELNHGKAQLPLPMSSLLEKLCPSLLDGSNGVRAQLLKLFKSLSPIDIRDHVSKILPYVRAGMTHLSRDIRLSAIEFLSMLLNCCGLELVSCAGGWYKTLECFITILGWRLPTGSKWSSGKASVATDVKMSAHAITALAEFLQTGLYKFEDTSGSQVNSLAATFPLWHSECLMIPTKSNTYAYLNLFGPPQDEENQMLEDRDDRLAIYNKYFNVVIVSGIEPAKKEGGELGRAAGLLVKVLDRVRNEQKT